MATDLSSLIKTNRRAEAACGVAIKSPAAFYHSEENVLVVTGEMRRKRNGDDFGRLDLQASLHDETDRVVAVECQSEWGEHFPNIKAFKFYIHVPIGIERIRRLSIYPTVAY